MEALVESLETKEQLNAGMIEFKENRVLFGVGSEVGLAVAVCCLPGDVSVFLEHVQAYFFSKDKVF